MAAANCEVIGKQQHSQTCGAKAMKRRQLLKLATASAAAAAALPDWTLAAVAEFDKYGGWTGRKFRATGYFRIEKDDRWWLVTPDGNAFLLRKVLQTCANQMHATATS